MMTIIPISGYSPSFSWQVGFNSIASQNNSQQFRATVRTLNGLEEFTRIPSSNILYEETGIVVNNWTFPLSLNASLSGGPYRDYQVVIEAYDGDGNTSAGNFVGGNNENGWVAYNQGYDIIAITNPRQTGIELSNNLPTLISCAYTGSGTNLTGVFSYNSGNGYQSLNYMGTHGEINIRYLTGIFDSNLVGGFIYVWTGQFPKLETAQGISGYNVVSKSQFSFDPDLGYVYHPTAAMAFRGANSVYVSLSFYDNLDQEALDNGIDISTGLYLSDNAICYNDIAAGSISIGGFQSIYSMQYTGLEMATGILGTGVSIITEQKFNGNTSVLYLSNPINLTSYQNYTGHSSLIGGGAGGNSILLNNSSTNFIKSFTVNIGYPLDDSMSIWLNGFPIYDNDIDGDPTTLFDIVSSASQNGYILKNNDLISFYTKNSHGGSYSTAIWTGIVNFYNGKKQIATGGSSDGGDFVNPYYYTNGYMNIQIPH